MVADCVSTRLPAGSSTDSDALTNCKRIPRSLPKPSGEEQWACEASCIWPTLTINVDKKAKVEPAKNEAGQNILKL
jgi:hypothetical protein